MFVRGIQLHHSTRRFLEGFRRKHLDSEGWKRKKAIQSRHPEEGPRIQSDGAVQRDAPTLQSEDETAVRKCKQKEEESFITASDQPRKLYGDPSKDDGHESSSIFHMKTADNAPRDQKLPTARKTSTSAKNCLARRPRDRLVVPLSFPRRALEQQEKRNQCA